MRYGMRTAAIFAVAILVKAVRAEDAVPLTEEVQLETIVVTGTRAPGRTALRSASPVEVISSERLVQTGYADLARALQFADPSVNYPRAQTTPSAANTRAITLRGLSPDEVLVLVNGKRWHASPVINVNFAVGRGTAPFDLSTIPLAAIERIEVLRDSAAAQYGSDAIAGVINIILKSEDGGRYVGAQAGITEQGDGGNTDATFSGGYALGDDGRLSLTAEAGYQDPTNRAALDQRYGRETYRIGDPRVFRLGFAASAVVPVTPTTEFYDDLLLSRKDSSNAVNFRPPGSSPLYPDGFLPKVNPVIWSLGNSLGLRFDLPYALRADVGNTFGLAKADFTVRDSANASLGLDSPTTFDAGGVSYLQDVIDLTLSRALPELLSGGNLAFGGQLRYENYEMERGETAATTGAGSQGFPGYNPRVPVDESRRASAAFLDVELKPLRRLDVGAALRYDHYDDFGGEATWKASLRYQAQDWLALRTSASTGFRAPSLQQQHYNSISTLANGADKGFVNVGLFQVADPVARALGAAPLKSETSQDVSLGFVLTPSPQLSFTADWFRVDIDDRVALSDALSGATVTAALQQAGITDVQQVAFFTNALDTRTQGYDLVGKYRTSLGESTDADLSIAYQRSPTTVRRQAGNETVPELTLVGQHARLLLTEAQPVSKLSSQLTLHRGAYTGSLQVTRFGEYTDAPVRDPQTFGAETVVDLSFGASLATRLDLTLGVLNIGDAYPDPLAGIELAYQTFGGSYVYSEASPFGVAGRSYYARLSYSW